MGSGGENRIDAEERESLERYYDQLSTEERRDRIYLSPAYRNAYNGLIQAHRSVEQPEYFWTHWVPILGPVAALLYMRLRHHCFSHAESAESRGWTWPTQERLAQEIGISCRKGLRSALRALEEHGFIRRDPTYRPDAGSGKPHRGTDQYTVFYEVPLLTPHAVDLLIIQSRQLSIEDPIPYVGEKRPHRTESVDNSPMWGKNAHITLREKRPHNAEGKTPSKYLTLNAKPLTVSRADSPHIDPLKDALAEEIAEVLEDPDSTRFYLIVAYRMPELAVRQALSEAKAAALERRLNGRAGAYFTAVIKRMATDMGIELIPRRAEP